MPVAKPEHFNDLLEHFGIPLDSVKLLRNQDGRLTGRSVYDLWRNHRPDFEQYQAIQRPQRRFPPNSHVASFVRDPIGRTLFAGLYLVEDARIASESDSSPVPEARIQPNDFIHDMKHLQVMEGLEGTLAIDWGPGKRATVQKAINQNKTILSIPDVLKDLGTTTTVGGLVQDGPIGQQELSGFDSAAILIDQRQKSMQEVVDRLGQDRFRASLMAAYGRRCAITGCSVSEVLEAAHIIPYTGDASDHVCNGLLLRSDIHKLFDALLITIDPDSYTITMAPRLQGTVYEKLLGRKIKWPESVSQRPSDISLRHHFDRANL